jgi:hypothetical protein
VAWVRWTIFRSSDAGGIIAQNFSASSLSPWRASQFEQKVWRSNMPGRNYDVEGSPDCPTCFRSSSDSS